MEPEIWKPIKENPFYYVSNLGRVKSVDHPVWCRANNSYSVRKGHIMKPNNQNSKHYWRIPLPTSNGRKIFAIHRLVAQAFIPNPDNLPQINHIDGNKDNNCVSNLEWCDQSHNFLHAYANNLVSKEKQSLHCHLRKLTEEEVLYIKSEFDKTEFKQRGDKMHFCEAMRQKFNLKSKNTVFEIIQGRTNRYIQ